MLFWYIGNKEHLVYQESKSSTVYFSYNDARFHTVCIDTGFIVEFKTHIEYWNNLTAKIYYTFYIIRQDREVSN